MSYKPLEVVLKCSYRPFLVQPMVTYYISGTTIDSQDNPQFQTIYVYVGSHRLLKQSNSHQVGKHQTRKAE